MTYENDEKNFLPLVYNKYFHVDLNQVNWDYFSSYKAYVLVHVQPLFFVLKTLFVNYHFEEC
jgi:hypothetical protein